MATSWSFSVTVTSMVGAGGVVTTTPSASANPKVSRCGEPGVSAELSEKLTIVNPPDRVGPLDEGPALDEVDEALPLLPQAARTAALAPARRNDRRSRRSGI